jgi:serine/threonine protein kinase
MKECGKCGLCFGDEVDVCPEDSSKTRLSLPGGRLLAERYFLIRRIGRGAMGQVYLAQDQNLGTREVAVKTVRQDILNSDDLQEGEAIARFEREAMSAASIRHPHIVDVTDFGESGEGVFYLVMEYVEGETLHRLLRREGTLPIKRAVKILRQIADGVEAAHDAGVLHRDLKPANIFLMQKKQNREGFVKVGDFGLAKIVSQTVTDTTAQSTPSSRGIIGTPEFMSPEQMQPELGVDMRADVYALGTIAYLMLAGRTPFIGEMMELVMQKVIQEPPPLHKIRTDIPRDVADVIMSALEKEPLNRVGTVNEWISKLEEAASDVGDAENTGSSKLTVLAPAGAEIYVNDERKGSIGRSGRLVLSSVPAGQHVLRVAKKGERDDERVIELREGGEEQVINAELKPIRGSQPSPSQGTGSSGVASSLMPGIVACTNCGSRFAQGVQFCGRCGNREFLLVSGAEPESGFSCPRCLVLLPENTKFCGRCGLSISADSNAGQAPLAHSRHGSSSRDGAPNHCFKCNTTYPPGVKFCGRCGTSIV